MPAILALLLPQYVPCCNSDYGSATEADWAVSQYQITSNFKTVYLKMIKMGDFMLGAWTQGWVWKQRKDIVGVFFFKTTLQFTKFKQMLSYLPLLK